MDVDKIIEELEKAIKKDSIMDVDLVVFAAALLYIVKRIRPTGERK